MPNEKPHILFIMADQFRHDHLGCLGAHPVETPNLDALAASGTLLTHCCSNAPVCAPARICLATGLNAEAVGAPDNNAYLPRSRRTYYQRLRDHGYVVGCVGKLDLAKPSVYNGVRGQRPCVYGWGFTHPLEAEGKMHAARGPQGPYGAFLQERDLWEAFRDDYARRAGIDFATECQDSVLPTDAWEDGYIRTESVRWLHETPTDFPWHLFVSFVGPHDPFDPPTEYADRYRDTETVPAIPLWDREAAPAIRGRVRAYDPEVIAKTRRQYIAEIKALDDFVGEILAALDERGERDSTVIVFCSDHGEMLGDLGMFTKSVPYEASLRVPLIVAGPGVTAGVKSDALIELADLNPTLCELAGLPHQEGIDAESFAPLLRGEIDTHRDCCISSLRPFRSIRTATHKLVNWNDGGCELYDLLKDPEERHNIAADNRPRVNTLAKRMRQRFVTDLAWNR